jgi:shikimate dehydrogenase
MQPTQDPDPSSPAAIAWARLSGSSVLFPVVGHPVAQVRAPAVFNALFAQAGIDAVAFGLDLPADSVAAGCRALLASPSVGGILVTVPHKKVLCPLADRLGADAQLAGSLNALRRGPAGSIEGDLFDGTGFVRGLQAAGHRVGGRRVLVLGAGGAGAAIAAKLGQEGAAVVALHDPVPGSAEALASRLQPRLPATRLVIQPHADPDGFDTVVNASPLGLRPDDPLPIDPARLAAGTLVCDVIMQPATTRLIQEVLAIGLPVHRGRAMLDHQVAAYLSFFGYPELAARVHVTDQGLALR